jgi:hypothetical protein
MKIGFDFDKVFIDYPPFLPSILFDKCYKQQDNGILKYRIPSPPEQLLRKALHLPFLRPLIKENFAVLKKIPQKDNNLYLISSRYHFLKPETQRLIKKYNLQNIFTKMYFNFNNEQPHEFKNTILQQLHLDYYIDDDLSLIKHAAKSNPNTTFFWLNYRNKIKHVSNNIIPITTLAEIFDKIKKR